jgi:hypothetical protein
MSRASLKSKVAMAAVIIAGLALFASPRPANAQVNTRQRYQPVTFTQEGWSRQGAEFVYSRWQYAFSNFNFYGYTRRNWLYAGCKRKIGIEGSTAGLTALLNFLPQTSAPRSLSYGHDFIIPSALTDVGALAGEVVALTMNVAFNDTRMMPRHPGYDIELFKLRAGPMRGKTVGQVLDIANRVLGGDHPARYGVSNHVILTDIVRAINANYEFINYDTYIDRGYLIPNRAFGSPTRAHYPHVP